MSLGGGRRRGARFGVPIVDAEANGLALPAGLFRLAKDGLQNYASAMGLAGDNVELSVDERLERPDSTVFKVTASLDAESSMVCYVKSFRVPPHRPWMEQRLRNRVERSALMGRMRDSGDGTRLLMPEVLATDPDQLAIVSVGIDGDPLGKAWRHLVTPRRLVAAEQTFVGVGRAIRDVEAMSLGRAEPTTYLDEERVQRALDIVLPVLSRSEAERTAAVVRTLHDEYAASPGGSYYCHGDINHSNVLIDGDQVNLIDFDLSSRPRTFDLSMFLLRLDLERPVLRPWTEKVKAWVVEGYGQSDVAKTPAFSLVRLIKLSGGIARNVQRGNQRRIRRYVARLEESLFI